MNTKLIPAWIVLAASLAFTLAASAEEVVVVRTYKVDGQMVGITSDFRMVGIVCHRGMLGSVSGADLVFPNSKDELNLSKLKYNPPAGRNTAFDRAAFTKLTEQAAESVCNRGPSEYTMAISKDAVEVIGQARDYVTQSWGGSNPQPAF